MKIKKVKKTEPSRKLDTQLFPECVGTKEDRDVVKKNRRRYHANILTSFRSVYGSDLSSDDISNMPFEEVKAIAVMGLKGGGEEFESLMIESNGKV